MIDDSKIDFTYKCKDCDYFLAEDGKYGICINNENRIKNKQRSCYSPSCSCKTMKKRGRKI